ncbi:MAG: hypothetical protein FJ308_18780 [Planctomycetes bacterium]|nr:hypothetical protein [Planctomycetota bacterium]
MSEIDMQQWKEKLLAPIYAIEDSFIIDFSDKSDRPTAPLDSIIERIQATNCPFLFKCRLDDAVRILHKQLTRKWLSENSKYRIEVAIKVIHDGLKRYRIDLASAITPKDTNSQCYNDNSAIELPNVLREKLTAILRITGPPLGSLNDCFSFATWSEHEAINDRLFPESQRRYFNEEFDFAELMIPEMQSVIAIWVESYPLCQTWGELLAKSLPNHRWFSQDAVIIPIDLSWFIGLTHGDYGVFAQRDMAVLV